MTAGRSDRGPVRLRRRGRHTTPTQVEKVAQQATKAAPAVAIAGALVAAPHASHALADSAKPAAATAQSQQSNASAASTATTHTATATLDSFATRTVNVTGTNEARHAATAQGTTYQVRNGDTLSKIATQFFHNNDWQYLFHENEKTISDPNLIFVGESLLIPATAPAHYAVSDYVPRHSKPAEAAAPAASTVASTSSSQGSGTAAVGGAVVTQSASLGQYSCSALETLWEQAGGSAASAFMAAEIAMAESGGLASAISPTDDFGLWQINGSNGALATLNPFQNAKSAIELSQNGTNWGPWTTFHSGAYSGKC